MAERPVLLSPFGRNGGPEVDLLPLVIELSLDELDDGTQILDPQLESDGPGDRHPVPDELVPSVEQLGEQKVRTQEVADVQDVVLCVGIGEM